MRPRRGGMLGGLVLAMAGCASTGGQSGGSTRLTASDFDVTVHAMVESLASSDLLASRRPNSPSMRIVTRKVQNLSSDVMTPAEQWMSIARVQAAAPLQQFAMAKNITFQIPPEEAEMLRKKGFDTTLRTEQQPTHMMTATFRSATRTVTDAHQGFTQLRKDYYLLEYEILDVKTRERVWSDTFEFAREAVGLVID